MKSKKVLTILLSLAIMVTFMPTFAFAVDADGHNFVEDKANSIVAEKCGSYGVYAEKCEAKTFDQACSAVKYTAQKKSCEYQKVKMSVSDFLSAVAVQTPGDAQAKATAVAANKLLFGDACYLFVWQCKDCGTVKTDTIGQYAVEKINHIKSSSVTCKDDVCSVCGAKIAATTTHNATGDTETYEKFCGRTSDRRTVTLCKDCGEVANTTYEFLDNTDTTIANIMTKHNWGPAVDTTGYTQAQLNDLADKASKGYYVVIDGKYYATTIVKEPTCTDTGIAVLTCKDCGLPYVSNYLTSATGTGYHLIYNWNGNRRDVEFGITDAYITVAATGVHTYEHYDVAATCEQAGASFDLCTACNTKANIKSGARATGHNFAVKVLKDRTCDTNGVVIISCDKCGKEWLAGTDKTIGTTKNVGDLFVGTDKKIYLVTGSSETATGDTSKSYLEVPDWRSEGHKYGAYEKIADATCKFGAVEATKCSKCEHYDVHHAKQTGKALGHEVKEIVVPATCGAYGYSYKVCTRCDEYISKDGTQEYREYYDQTNPVVELGAECNFQWASLDDETDALICTVCKAVKEGSETPKTDDAKKAAQVEKAKPIIEAAANILSESDKYTDDSVAAIEEAKAKLNSAIAAGTSTDVKNMAAELQAAVDGAQLKVANTMTASGKTIKASKNKTKTFKKSKAFSVKNAKGKVTFAKKSGNGKIVVSKKGKVTVKSGLKKGTYPVKVAVTAAGNGNYLPKTKVVTLKVKVK